MSKKNRSRSSLPARGAAVSARQYRISFDVDCGELVAGHHFIARGLSHAGTVTRPMSPAAVPAFAFEYELVPGVPRGSDDHGFFRYLVGIQYVCDVALPWEPTDGGAIAPFEGGPSTHGSRGDWPLPAGARVLTFTLYGIDASGYRSSDAAGVLVVDLARTTVDWRPA